MRRRGGAETRRWEVKRRRRGASRSALGTARRRRGDEATATRGMPSPLSHNPRTRGLWERGDSGVRLWHPIAVHGHDEHLFCPPLNPRTRGTRGRGQARGGPRGDCGGVKGNRQGSPAGMGGAETWRRPCAANNPFALAAMHPSQRRHAPQLAYCFRAYLAEGSRGTVRVPPRGGGGAAPLRFASYQTSGRCTPTRPARTRTVRVSPRGGV
jgi:hypothetical protein